MSRGPRAKKVKEWTDRFRRFNASGQTVVGFCQTEQVSTPSFYQWRKKLASTSKRRGSARRKSVSKANGFQELRVIPQPSGGNAVTIRLPSGITLELDRDLAVIENVATQLFDRHDRTVLGKRQTAGGGSC
mgnify:CR=1 FL=1